ncbi:transferase family protein [Xylariaceae sp. FL0594]|nr:transferase family protein [Xylariaceae sp. FL0594]
MDELRRQLRPHAYDLSPLDIIPNHLYLTNIFFFENTGTGSSSTFIPEDVLKDSLYDALSSFPILLGHLKPNGLNTMHIVVDPDNPVLPIWETLNFHILFEDLKKHTFHRDHWPEGLNIEDPLLHADDDGQAPPHLIRVRVCRFAENSGLALVVRLSHSVFDAKGCTFFINYWAARCRRRLVPSAPVTPPIQQPILDRAVMYKHLSPRVRPTPLSWFLWPISFLLVNLLTLLETLRGRKTSIGSSQSHLFRLRRETLDRLKTDETAERQVSDNDIITALFTMAYAQLLQAKQGGSKKPKLPKEITAIVPCDFRHRLGVPEAYTGSCAVGLYVTCPFALLIQPISSSALLTAAGISRQTVDGADAEVIEGFAKRAMMAVKILGEKVRTLYSLMVAQAFSNQSRLPFYEADFGGGRPVFVAPMAYSKSLAVILPSPPESRDICVFLTLEVDDMRVVMENEDFRSIVEIIY